MSPSMFYSLDTMTVNQWFSMLANQPLDNREEETQEEKKTLVYEVTAPEDFIVNGDVKGIGTYYMRADADEIATLPESLQVRKLSFSEIVFLSDIFSLAISNLLPEPAALDELAQKGQASHYFETELNTVPSKGLEVMRERVWTKYFDDGMMGIVRRFFSSIANLFRKYSRAVQVETGIFWPGNSCYYADQVVQQLNKVKSIFICAAYEASKEVLSERLDLSIKELESLSTKELKTCYIKKVLLVHPDKTKGDPVKTLEFQKINRAWGDFLELTELKKQFQSYIDDFSDEMYEREEEVDLIAVFMKTYMDNYKPFPSHQFKHLLSLPAPISVS